MKPYRVILRDVQASYRGSKKQEVILESQSLLQVYLLKPASLYLTPLFVWLGLTPNQVTWLGFLVGLAACLLLASGPPALVMLGAWLYLLHRLLDHVDGNLARYSGRMSSYGHFLDGSLGAIIQMALFLGVGAGAYQQCRAGDALAPDFLFRHPEALLLAGALVSSFWMVGRFIKLFHDCTFEGAPRQDSAAVVQGAVGRPGRSDTITLWNRARRARGLVPVVRVIGLIVAAHTSTLVPYLGFFFLYFPVAFAVQFTRLLRSAAASTPQASAPLDLH